MEKDGPTCVEFDIDDGKDPDRVWETCWHRLKEDTVEGTGDWLENNHQFVAWARGQTRSNPFSASRAKMALASHSWQPTSSCVCNASATPYRALRWPITS